MRVRKCSECGRPAEPPFTIWRSRLPDELIPYAEAQGLPDEREFVFCEECLDRFQEEEQLVKEQEEGYRAGTICGLCSEELDPPGGTTAWSFDRKRLIRLCPKCKATVEQWRKERGQE
jgi:hypothetical protein